MTSSISFTSPTLTGYNATPPPDDGSTGANNQIEWSKHIDKIGDPLRTYLLALAAECAVEFGVAASEITSLQGDVANNTPPGVIFEYAGSSAPTGWLLCDGSAVSRTTYADLFNVIGEAYGVGDGSTTFNLPDRRGRVGVGKDDMGGSAAGNISSTGTGAGPWSGDEDTLGSTMGSDRHTLTAAQSGLPAHNHTLQYSGTGTFNSSNNNNLQDKAIGAFIRSTNTENNSAQNASAAHPNTQPGIIMNYIIKT